MHAYPILLDLFARPVLIVGGGRVAVRKARGLLDAGATDVRCVAPEIHPDMPAAVHKWMQQYKIDHLSGISLVFAATSSAEVNSQVLADAKVKGILASRADTDADQPGDFIVPARWSLGGITLAVSAGSAALAVKIRDELSNRVDPVWIAMAEAMQTLRPIIRDRANLSADRRCAIFADLATDQAFDALASGGLNELKQWLITRHPELQPCFT